MQKIIVPKGFTKTKDLLKREKLVPHLERAIERYDDPWEFSYVAKEKDLGWHPSGDCTPTATELYEIASKRLKEIPSKPFPASTKKTFMVGHFWHQWLQFVVEKKLKFCDNEAIERRGVKTFGHYPFSSKTDEAFKPFLFSTGSADIAPCSIPKHGDFAIDFKTMGVNDFKLDVPPPRFADKWECQMNIYMDFFDLERTLVVPICKDSPHGFKEFEYHRNQPLIDVIYRKWEFVGNSLLDKDPPTEKDDEEFSLPLRGTSV